jgi:hypothetical protein
MATVDITDYSASVTPGSPPDWSPALVAAWNDVKTYGGTINFDQLLTTLKTTCIMQGRPVPLHLVGDGGNKIQPVSGPLVTILNIADLALFTMKGLNIVGDGDTGTPRSTDTGAFIYLGYVLRAVIEKCLIAGIKPAGNLIEFGNGTLATMRDCKISGNQGYNVVANSAYELDIENCDFLDYLSYNDSYHDKATEGAAWIYAHTPPPGVVGASSPSISIRRCRFDEAAGNGIYIKDYPRVIIDQCRFNISSAGFANGIKLENVKHAIIRQCHVGYNNVDKPVIKLINCENVVVIGQGKDTNPLAPYRIERDNDTNLVLLDSPDISVTVV